MDQPVEKQISRRRARRIARAERDLAKAKSPVRIVLLVLGLPLTVAAVMVSVTVRTSGLDAPDALRALVARFGCDAAKAVRLAPAYEGEIGYHARNDADGDGIACEQADVDYGLQFGFDGQDIAVSPEVPEGDPPRMTDGAKFLRIDE